MKKTFSLVLTLALVIAIAMGVGVPAFAAASIKNTDAGYVTMDTLILDGAYYSRGDAYVRDLFWTGSIGSAESSGTLDIFDDSTTWTLKDGVLILTGHPEKSPYNQACVASCVTYNSPLWNNEHIETIVIDGEIYNTDRALFRFGLPNLKNVIFLGNTLFSVVHTYGMYGTITNAASFPTDHEINYVWEAFNDGNSYGRHHNYPYAVGTSVDADTFEADNAYFTDRAYYLAAAAPVVARATMTKEAVDMLPEDMVAAVAAIGGFKSFGGNPLTIEQSVVEYNKAHGINVTVNGTLVEWTDAIPFIDENDRTMVPLRAVADAMDVNVEWNPPYEYDGILLPGSAIFTKGEKSIIFKINHAYATAIPDGIIEMDTRPVIKNDRTYAPIRYLAEFFGYTVNWDGATQTVIITS